MAILPIQGDFKYVAHPDKTCSGTTHFYNSPQFLQKMLSQMMLRLKIVFSVLSPEHLLTDQPVSISQISYYGSNRDEVMKKYY